MDYIGEHLFPGQVGHLLIILSFVASLIGTFAFYRSFHQNDEISKRSWLRLGRICFWADAISIIAVFFILYSLIAAHRYEYFYVYKNSGNDLEPKYILSSLWSASEGSFLLWAFWHAILGIVLMYTARRWEGPVMMVMTFTQLCLATMMLGLFIFDNKIGSSPFALFRDQMSNLPLFQYANYLERLTDGQGLNQLLQNYWMVIHPPVLFLGFSAFLVPFSFAIGGLMTRDHEGWTKPALPWALFAAAVLGLGVMMGAAWAYESLSFGGYWAWDPVENASLVPWLILVAGIHTLVIHKHTGRSLRSSYLLIILSYILIIYSTFLTRSGILGDSSVHSFADLGMNFQLLMFILVFLIPSAILFARNYRSIPHIRKEEETSSREFWMFIGSLVLFFSGMLIIGKTSLPVINKVFGSNIAPPKEVEHSYNGVMIWIAIIIGMLTAVTQYLKYKQTPFAQLKKKFIWPTIVSMIVAVLVLVFGDINYREYGAGFMAAIWIAVTFSVYALIANAAYIWLGVKGKLALSGPSIAHAGFAMMMLGILISSARKETLSWNTSGIMVNFGPNSQEKSGENLTLVKGQRMDMGKYWVTYESDSIHPKKSQWYYTIRFKEKEGDEEFTLVPNAFINYKGNEGLMANPDARHYLDHDIFAYITSLPDPEKNKDTTSLTPYKVSIGDSIFYSKGYLVLDSIITNKDLPVEIFGEDGLIYEARIRARNNAGNSFILSPRLAFARETWIPVSDTLNSESLIVQLNAVDGGNVELGVKESNSVLQYLTLKAYKFPYINLLWLGTLLMIAGFIISLVRRVRVG